MFRRSWKNGYAHQPGLVAITDIVRRLRVVNSITKVKWSIPIYLNGSSSWTIQAFFDPKSSNLKKDENDTVHRK